MTARHVGIALGAAAVALVVSAPFLLREVAFFRLRQVELVGLQYHSADRVLDALGLAEDHNIFEPTKAVRRRAEALPGVARAQVMRRLPGTLTILVEERQPVAFVPSPDGLGAVDADARPLPYDPAATGLDLPVIEQVDSMLTRMLSLVRAADPVLYDEAESAERTREGVILIIGRQQILWRGVPSMHEIRAVQAVRHSLGASGRTFDRLDARFAGAVFVRLSPA